MKTRAWWPIGIIVILTAAAVFALYGGPEKAASPVSELAILLSVNPEAGTINVDPVEWLQGEEAIQAALKAYPECSRKNIEDCAATLANNFYIQNAEKQSLTYSVPPQAVLRILEGGSAEFQPSPSTLADLAARLEGIQPGSRLIRLTRTGNKVLELEEVYMP